MDHAHSEVAVAPAASRHDDAPARGIAVASISLGFFSIVIFFWHPFSTCLASVGLVLSSISLIRGVRGGLRGEPLALIGFGFCAFSLAVVLTLNQALRFVMWEH